MLPLEARALLHGHGGPEPLDSLPGNAPITPVAPSTQVMSLGSLPQLSSYSAAPAKLYLNFVGAPTQTWGSYTASAPAYDTDGDDATFSTTEIAQIREIWSRVAEKYSPFNIDVTTVDPGSYPAKKVAHVVIGGEGLWSGGTYGGYSYVGGFIGQESTTGWVFSKNLGKGFPKYVAEATAHEAGHLFGLYHQSTFDSSGNKTNEYSRGTGPLAPIMGASYFAERGLWWTGPSNSASTIQYDLESLGGIVNGFGFRPDDHGGTLASAALLEVTDGIAARGAGVIETIGDVDYFRFTSTGGLVNLAANVAEFGPMLDLSLKLTDANGNVLALADTVSLGELVSALVPAGDYYLAVASHGGYGDVGQYTIEGTVVPEPLSAPLVAVLGAAWLLQRPAPRAGRHNPRANKFAHATLLDA
jgi:hypothetical protein